MLKKLSILVLGAGELGKAILRGLSHRSSVTPISLSVLLRPVSVSSANEAKRRDVAELRAMGVDIITGDLLSDSPADLVASFQRFDVVVSCTGFAAGRGTQTKITRAVLAAGVKRYVPWQFGVDYDAVGRGSAQDLWDEQIDVRDLLRSQNATGWSIISTGMFTSFLFEPTFGVVDLARDEIHALGSWDNRVTVTAAPDIGNLSAEILLRDAIPMNRVIYTAGDTTTYARLADVVDDVLKRKLRRSVLSVQALRSALETEPGSDIRKYRLAFAEGRGVAWDLNRSFNVEFNIPTLNVEQWLRAAVRDNHIS